MRLIFMGSSKFAVPSLRVIVGSGLKVTHVITQPPRKSGRGRKLLHTPVGRVAEELGLRVETPEKLEGLDFLDKISQTNANLGILVAYGKIIPASMLKLPARGFLNLHPSLLPRWRGAAPIQRTLMAGDHETGVCVISMDEGLDTGPIMKRKRVEIEGRDTASILEAKLASLGASLLLEVISSLDDLVPVPQPEEGATYAAKIDKSEGRIDWHESANMVDAKIRGLARFPGAWSNYRGRRIKILNSETVPIMGTPGRVLNSDLVIGCGRGAVRVIECQAEGGRAMPASDFLRGVPIRVGDTFS